MSEALPLLSIDRVKLEDNFMVEELSLSEYRNDEDGIDKETKIWTSDFISPKSLKSEDDHSLSTAEVKLEDDSSKEKSSFNDCENDEEDSKSFQEQVIEGGKIWKREDFSLHESCVLYCDDMQLNENTFPGYGQAMEETDVNICQRCKNSETNGSNLNCRIGNVISEYHKNGMCGDKSRLECDIGNIHLKVLDDKGNTEPSKNTSFQANIDEECETTYGENLEQIKGVDLELKSRKCHMCNNTASEESKLEDHNGSEHLKLETYKCRQCQHKTTHKVSLKKHKCDMCEFTTTRKYYLRTHVNNVHLKLKNHKCQQCEFASAHKNALEAHIKRIHLKVKNRKCHMCEYASTDKRNLQIHIEAVHLKLKNHMCHMCEFATASKSRLQIHIEGVHLKLKNHKCHMCEYAATEKATLNSHIKSVHLKLKNHKCQQCDLVTFHKNVLERHIKRAHQKL